MKSQFDEFLKKAGVVIDSERARILKVLEDYVQSQVIEEVSKRITAFEKTPAEWFEFLNNKIDKIKYGFSRIEMAPGVGIGDMLKSVYDTNDNGVVDNSEKLEGSTKAQVQDHAPKAHKLTHQNGGADEINVAGLSGELADPQPPKAHKASHEAGGSDALTALLRGIITDFWNTPFWANIPDKPSTFPPDTHATSHQNGGADEINVAGLNGELADPQPPKTHASSHQNGGADEISVAGLSGELADPQPPKTHAASHKDGGADELDASELAGALGTDGQVLKSDGAASNWEDDIASITFIIDGGGSAITTGEKGHLRIPFACEIQRVTLLADQTGSIVIDIWKDTYANFPPTDADSITASAPPTISSAQKSEDSTLTGWTKTINAGDILAFNVDSAATITRVTLSLKVKKM